MTSAALEASLRTPSHVQQTRSSTQPHPKKDKPRSRQPWGQVPGLACETLPRGTQTNANVTYTPQETTNATLPPPPLENVNRGIVLSGVNAPWSRWGSYIQENAAAQQSHKMNTKATSISQDPSSIHTDHQSNLRGCLGRGGGGSYLPRE